MTHFEKAALQDHYEEAKEELRNLLEKGILPIVTVPRQYLDSLKQGLKKSSCWLGENILAGTIGREPYFPKGESRIAARINISSADQVEPRLTGPDRAFHGVVVFRGPIGSEQIEIIRSE